MKFYSFFLLILFSILQLSCDKTQDSNEGKAVLTAQSDSDDFAKYWFAGKAELNTFDIVQNRYGEERKGEAVMVFVTEDFSKEKQVKLDNPSSAGNDKVPVMKLNHIRRFVTGIYDYSMMLSVFTPIDLKKNKQTLKTTTTSQDWCGHSFMQLNLDGNKYQNRGFSYFESEGDRGTKMEAAFLEDELWTRLRINPSTIPAGNIDVIPSTFFSRLRHQDLAPQKAEIKMEKGDEKSFVTLTYKSGGRSLRIGFETDFPHQILDWEEKTGGRLISSGKRKAVMKSAYWQQNGNGDEYLRESLQMN